MRLALFPKPQSPGILLLIEEREKLGLTQVQLSKLLHVHKNLIGHVETGKKPITEELAKNLERIFKITYTRFVSR